jgi:mono/diheme cytochrome c family protein
MLIAGLLWSAMATASASPANRVAEGRAIAIDACSACHQVTNRQKPPAPVPNPDELTLVAAPSFAQIARDHGADEAYLRDAITAPKHPMREQEWRQDDLNAVIAYIRSLDTHRRTP